MKYILFLLLCVFSITSFAQKTPVKNKPVPATKTATDLSKSWLIYKDSIDNFSFKYPTDWTIRIAEATEKARVFVRSPSEGAEDSFTENINIMLRPVNAENIPVKDLQKSIKSALESKMKDYQLLVDKFVQWNGVQAYHIEYTATQKTGDEEIPVWVVQRLMLKKKVLYTATYVSAKDGSKDYYTKAIQIINSFKLN